MTKGDFESLTILKSGLFFEICAGIAGANFTFIPIKLLNKYDPRLVCGWAMLLGSIPIQPIVSIDTPHVNLNPTLRFELIFIIIVGTMLSYLFYVAGLNYLEPVVTGILSSFGSLTAAILSVSFLI
ncbi:DMT family transporter [Apilactobacillus kunkeei]|nr:DMT family transporter [Apilactobacillus kunkeei]